MTSFSSTLTLNLCESVFLIYFCSVFVESVTACRVHKLPLCVTVLFLVNTLVYCLFVTVCYDFIQSVHGGHQKNYTFGICVSSLVRSLYLEFLFRLLMYHFQFFVC